VNNYVYLRVSTDRQDVGNQRHGLLEYANSHRLVPLEFREDTTSGQVRWQERGIGKVLLEEASRGDVILLTPAQQFYSLTV
jgi:DNA invertase Pin-like site-specific DNA recombinase